MSSQPCNSDGRERGGACDVWTTTVNGTLLKTARNMSYMLDRLAELVSGKFWPTPGKLQISVSDGMVIRDSCKRV